MAEKKGQESSAPPLRYVLLGPTGALPLSNSPLCACTSASGLVSLHHPTALYLPDASSFNSKNRPKHFRFHPAHYPRFPRPHHVPGFRTPTLHLRLASFSFLPSPSSHNNYSTLEKRNGLNSRHIRFSPLHQLHCIQVHSTPRRYKNNAPHARRAAGSQDGFNTAWIRSLCSVWVYV